MRFPGAKSSLCLLSAALASCFLAGGFAARAQQAPVTVQIEIVQNKADKNDKKAPSRSAIEPSEVVIWLSPSDGAPPAAGESSKAHPQLVQFNERFEPHTLVVQVGTAVQFPNKDHFFHNVFSLYDGKRFDLGFYEAGSSRVVRFERSGGGGGYAVLRCVRSVGPRRDTRRSRWTLHPACLVRAQFAGRSERSGARGEHLIFRTCAWSDPPDREPKFHAGSQEQIRAGLRAPFQHGLQPPVSYALNPSPLREDSCFFLGSRYYADSGSSISDSWRTTTTMPESVTWKRRRSASTS